MRTLTAAASLAAMALLAACSSAAAPSPPPGPVQDLTLAGASTIAWTASSGPQGRLPTAPPTAHAATGCYTWTGADGTALWSARISGTSAGHALTLQLTLPGGASPGTHAVPQGSATPGAQAVLTVDGAVYAEVHTDPADALPSYFTLDNNGTTGRLAIRFAATPNGPQAFDAGGRWHCE